jgi:caffeoyl-CoA O-methyltransferase
MEKVTREALDRYVRDLFAQEDHLLQMIREESAGQGFPQIHVRPEEGRMLQFLLTAVRARQVVEIGALAGYSGLWIARALPPDGRLISLEIDEEHAAFTRRIYEQAGLAGRAEVREGPALALLDRLAGEGPFDAVFVDADKPHYPNYLAWAVENLRPGGLVLAHNAFTRGRVIDPAQLADPGVRGIAELNQRIAEDPRLLGTIIPVGDGIAAAVRL